MTLTMMSPKSRRIHPLSAVPSSRAVLPCFSSISSSMFAAIAWFCGRLLPTMLMKNSVVTVRWLTRRARIPSALRMSAAFTAVCTAGSSGSSSRDAAESADASPTVLKDASSDMKVNASSRFLVLVTLPSVDLGELFDLDFFLGVSRGSSSSSKVADRCVREAVPHRAGPHRLECSKAEHTVHEAIRARARLRSAILFAIFPRLLRIPNGNSF
mmetsp:Transcript_29289/g.65581  ORF Transcript_29289/g.65581 Transcript_29289/m.65581 type:complete len:213 (-) Transcript_29289:19-657(-)